MSLPTEKHDPEKPYVVIFSMQREVQALSSSGVEVFEFDTEDQFDNAELVRAYARINRTFPECEGKEEILTWIVQELEFYTDDRENSEGIIQVLQHYYRARGLVMAGEIEQLPEHERVTYA